MEANYLGCLRNFFIAVGALTIVAVALDLSDFDLEKYEYKPTIHHGDEAVFARLSLALQPPPGKEHCGHYSLDLVKIAPFAWDSVYLRAGNTENNTGYATYQLGSCTWRGPQISDHYQRLFFVAQQKVVSYVDCSVIDNPYLGEKSLGIELDGECARNYTALGRAHAKLLTSHIAYGEVVRYPLVPADCPDSSRHALAPDCLSTAQPPTR